MVKSNQQRRKRMCEKIFGFKACGLTFTIPDGIDSSTESIRGLYRGRINNFPVKSFTLDPRRSTTLYFHKRDLKKIRAAIKHRLPSAQFRSYKVKGELCHLALSFMAGETVYTAMSLIRARTIKTPGWYYVKVGRNYIKSFSPCKTNRRQLFFEMRAEANIICDAIQKHNDAPCVRVYKVKPTT